MHSSSFEALQFDPRTPLLACAALGAGGLRARGRCWEPGLGPEEGARASCVVCPLPSALQLALLRACYPELGPNWDRLWGGSPHSRRDSGQVVHSWNGEQREVSLECAGGCKWRAHPWDVSRPVWAQECEMAGCVWRGHRGCGRSQGLLRAQNRKQQLQTWPQGC